MHISFGSPASRPVLLGLGMAFVSTPMTATAVSSVPFQQAGPAATGNNAFRQVGGALGQAVLGTLPSSKAVDALAGHLTDAGLTGLTGLTVHHGTAVADHDGIGAVAGLDLGADTPRVLGALSQSFLDGLHLCLIVSAVLTLPAAVGALLLRRPQHTPPVTESRDRAAAAATGPVTAGDRLPEAVSLTGNRAVE